MTACNTHHACPCIQARADRAGAWRGLALELADVVRKLTAGLAPPRGRLELAEHAAAAATKTEDLLEREQREGTGR